MIDLPSNTQKAKEACSIATTKQRNKKKKGKSTHDPVHTHAT